MWPVMWRPGFGIHANNNSKKAGKFWHDLIIPQGCGVVVSPYCGGRDRSAARTTVGGEFPVLALSIREAGSSFHHGPRFRRPPCDPGRWAFPRPVLTVASLRSPFHIARSFSADPPTLRHRMVCFQGRSMVHRPTMAGDSWNCQMPRAPLHARGVTSRVVVSATTSTGVTLLSSLVRAHAPVLTPPSASQGSSDSESVQVAVSPCGEEDLPDVVSAPLSLRAWTPPPAALEVP